VKATLRRILVVDDDPLLVELLSDYFTSEGYSVMPAATAEAALAAVRQVRPDVVLLDIGLPDGDGFDVLRHIRRYDPTIGVIMLTGHRNVGLARASIQMGAIDCVFKPIDLDRIGRAVAVGLGQEARSEAALASSILSAASSARASLGLLDAAAADHETQPVS
jgi:DNA-binding NtrC family response regulator